MTFSRRAIVWLALAAIVAMGIYPPWIVTLTKDPVNDVFAGMTSTTYYWIFDPPKTPQWFWNYRQSGALQWFWKAEVDVRRLAVQWAVVVIVAGGLLWTLKSSI